MTVSAVLSLLNLASVGVFGIVLSAAFCDLEWTRQRKGILAVSTVLMLALQAVVSLHWGTGLARYLYPVITHLPLFLLLAELTGKWLWPLVAVLTAYLCCQLRRWAALLVIALFPAGGTVLQDAMELLVTLPLLAALVRWCAPSVRSLSRSPLSEALARDLRRRGMRFFGPTVAYAFLQAAGVINGHEPGCFLAPPGGAAGPK